MGKRLVLILALAFVVGTVAYAYAEVQNVKVSGDITAYGIYRDLSFRDNKGPSPIDGSGPGNQEHALASVLNLRIDADLTDNVSAMVKLNNEKYWGGSTDEGGGGNYNTPIELSLASVTLKEFLYSPLTLTVGRQELHFGNDMIVGAVNTNGRTSANSGFFNDFTYHKGNDADLSTLKGFDAIRANFNYDPLVIDVVGAKINEGDVFENDDQNLIGFNANYKLPKIELGKLATLMNSVAELYFWDDTTGRAAFDVTAKNNRVDVAGGRFVTSPIEQMVAQIEAAYQFGKINNDEAGLDMQTLKAWALETALTYNWSKAKYTPSLTGMYAFFTGAKDTNTDGGRVTNAWQPMFENQKFGDIVNATMPQTNSHILGVVGTMKPMQDIIVKGEYYAYWFDKAFKNGDVITDLRGNDLKMTDKIYAGSEIDLTGTYNYTEDVQFNLLGGWYIPGHALDKVNRKLASEVIGSMKVTF